MTKAHFPVNNAGVTFGSVCLAFPEQGSVSSVELPKFGLFLGLMLVLGIKLLKSILKMKLINLPLMTDFCFSLVGHSSSPCFSCDLPGILDVLA